MKTIITSEKETIKVSKKEIKEILDLERGVSYYSHLNNNTLAHAIAMGQHEFVNTDVSRADSIQAIYEEIEEVIERYLSYMKYLEESTI